MKLSKQHSDYQSEITQFINTLKEKNPHLEESQRAGRALLWDKTPIDLDQQARNQASAVRQQAYVYQNKLK
jgi:fumarate hydratase class II